MDQSYAHPFPALVWCLMVWFSAQPQALILFEALVVLLGDALWWVQHSPGAGSHIPPKLAKSLENK